MRVFSALAVVTAAAALSASPLVDVFVGENDGYACYRIPALVRDVVGGRLLAIAEARRYGCGDAGYIDLVSKTSSDGGATWGALSLIRSESSRTANVTNGNPCPILLPDGSILLPFSRNNRGVGVLRSVDFGTTWSVAHQNLSIPADWTWVATGPPGGLAVASASGGSRALIPLDYRSRATGNAYFSSALLSDDGGATWRLGTGSVAGGNECQISELQWATPSAPFHPLLLTSRSSVGPRRLAALSTDGGDTWGAPWETIVETQCEGSTIALPALRALVTSSAFSPLSRINMTVHVSRDDGRTWVPLPTDSVYPGSSAYSALAPLAGGAAVGLLFERDGYARISYTAVDVA